MSNEHDAEPETADTGLGRRRARVDQVGAELAALRRDLGQQGGLLAELAPRVDDLSVSMGEVRAVLQRLVAEADEQDVADEADLEARRAAGLANEPPAPWAWPVMDRPTATAAYDALGRWVASTLCGQHQATLAVLPACWPAHPPVIAELTALRASHVAAHLRGAHPSAALVWARELPAALARVHGETGAIEPGRCFPGGHLVDPGALPPKRERDDAGRQLCHPDRWRPLLERVAAADVAWRRTPSEEPPSKSSGHESSCGPPP